MATALEMRITCVEPRCLAAVTEVCRDLAPAAWVVEERPRKDYTVFLHLRDDQGPPVMHWIELLG